MQELTDEMAQAIRLQMLYNIGNGWSWYAYKRLGPEKIIELELEMWKDLIPPAVDLFFGLIGPQGTPSAQAKFFLNQMTKVNGYVPKYLEETDTSLTWEYTFCPNWNSLVILNFDDYLALDGKPAKVSCIHGCTRIHEIYFRKIAPNTTVEHGKLRPNADDTCVFTATFK
jgi:hypothetical protein